MLTGFMLPSLGAFTIDGTIVLLAGVLAVVGIFYKNRGNIAFNDKDILINEEENTLKNINYRKSEEKISEKTKISSAEENVEDMEVYNKEEEKIKILN